MRNTTASSRSIALFLAAFTPMLASGPGFAQDIAATVNGEQITSSDVDQRMRWNALTRDLGTRMKAGLTGDAPKEKFRQMIAAAHPQSQQEALEAAARIKKQMIEDTRNQLLAEGGGIPRKAVVNQLIEDRLKVQVSKKLGVEVSDLDLEDVIQARVGGKGTDKKARTEAFFEQFEKQGVSRSSIKEVFRARLAWRNVIGRLYGQRIGTMPRPPLNAQADVHYDVKILKLAVGDPSGDKAAGERMAEAENLKSKFYLCAALPEDVKLIPGASIEAKDKATLADFPKDAQPLIAKAAEGRMTPPVLTGNAVEVYAVCGMEKADPREAAFDNYSRNYLQELREKASIDIRA